jgi:hypothetical protein
MAQGQYVVSTVDITLKDPSTEQVVAHSQTLMNGSLEQSVQSQDIYGGKGAALQYTYNYQKKLDVTTEDCEWKPEYVALNNGTTVANGSVTAQKTEVIALDGSGEGTLSETPTSTKVALISASGVINNVTPSGTTVTYLAWASTSVTAVYDYSSATTDYIVIDAEQFPGTFILVMDADLFDKDNGQIKIGSVQIRINRFKLAGNQTWTFDMQNPFTTGFAGAALKDANGNYATITIVRDSTDVLAEIIDLWLSPDSDTLDDSDGDELQLVAYGYRGSGKDVIVDPDGVTYASSNEAVATVGETTGLVDTAGAGSCVITGTLTVGGVSLTGSCSITVVS